MDDLLLKIKLNVKISWIILGVNFLLWVVLELLGGSTNPVVLLTFGAAENTLILSGQWWRLISSAFLHVGILHLLVNSYTLYQLGPFIEDFFGKGKFIATYVITAITAGLLSLLFSNSISAGASGALFGLVGLLLGNRWANKIYTLDMPIDERQLIPFVGYNLLYGFLVPGINNWAHIGGLLGGIALGYIFDPVNSFDPSRLKKIAPKFLAIASYTILFFSAVFWALNIFGIF